MDELEARRPVLREAVGPLEGLSRSPQPHLRLLGVFVLAGLLTGCWLADEPDVATPQASAAPLAANDAAAAAPDLLANGGLTLPAPAVDIEVDLVTYDEFREVSVTRFMADRAAAEAMCTDAGGFPVEDLRHGGYEKAMLGDFVVEPGMKACRVPADPTTNARVFISPEDPARVTVLIYGIPSR